MVAVRGAFRQLAEPLQWSLRGSAFFVPTRVQEEGIPRLLKGESLFVSSPSGTGKTLAYLLPILHLLHLPTLSSSLFSPPHIPSSRLRQLHKRPQEGKRSAAANRSAPAGSGAAAATAAVAASGPFCLVLTPTLELANQVAEEVRRFTRFVPELTVDVVTAAASQQAASQVRSLHCRPPLVLVATPGRLLRLFQEAASEKHPPLGPLIPTRTAVAPEGVTTETALPESGSSGGQPVSSGDAPSSSIKAEEWTESESAAGKTTAPDLAGGSELNVGIDNGKRKTQGLVPSCLPKDFLGQVRHWVVEECDKMAEMGLLEDLRKVFSLLPRPQRAKAGKKKDLRPHMQVILVSATILPESELLLRRFAPRGDMLIVQPSSSDKPLVKQLAYCVTPRRKTALLLYLLRRRASLKNHQVLVFVRTVHRVERLHQTLCEGGITAVRLHGELTGPVRSQSLEMFKQGNAQVLVSTNVAARGVDIPNLPFVVNFDPPGSPQEYLHRIGRTGRAGASGTAISFLEPLNEESSIGKRALATESQLGGRVQEESSQKADMPE
ncbi:unnamed protein product [Closterium sp. Naga37s-1]|nr:unnamed protein product [Closterium sp. Naga37s-1]